MPPAFQRAEALASARVLAFREIESSREVRMKALPGFVRPWAWIGMSWIAYLIGIGAAAGQETNLPELIVRLPPSADIAAVVQTVNHQVPPYPYGLAEGAPIAARVVVADRPSGRQLDWVSLHVNTPLARLY